MNGTASNPISIPGRVIVFDYGEVISVTPTDADRGRLLDLAGITPIEADTFWAAYWADREALDQFTITIQEYWRRIGTALGRAWSGEQIHQLWATDFTGWLSINPGTASVLEDLAAGGTRLALLSNAGPDYASFFRNGSLGALFEQVFVSGELGIVKPDAAIYLHVLDALGITPAEMIFVDNRDDNVQGAEALGITGYVFTSAAELRDYLTGIAALVPQVR